MKLSGSTTLAQDSNRGKGENTYYERINKGKCLGY